MNEHSRSARKPKERVTHVIASDRQWTLDDAHLYRHYFEDEVRVREEDGEGQFVNMFSDSRENEMGKKETVNPLIPNIPAALFRNLGWAIKQILAASDVTFFCCFRCATG